MTTFTAEKLGEVLAFAQVGAETFEKGRAPLQMVFDGMEGVDGAIQDAKEHADEIMRIAEAAGMADHVTGQAEKTAARLRDMRDTYLMDHWDKLSEVLEWHGFFEGAAIVHWSLVKGSSEGMGSEELHVLTLKAHDFHNEVLDTINVKITAYAKEKEAAA